ncbi:MAG: lipoprotein [Neisseria sp.]|nr:lipoprotein [Neisseria sp.]
MNSKIFLSALLLVATAACGFKGELYLPKKDDNATFGPVQTGIGLTPPAASEPAASEPQP